jgi:hypothetical protein
MLSITTEFLDCCCQGTTEISFSTIVMAHLKLASTFPHPASPATFRSSHCQPAPYPSSETMRKRYPGGSHILRSTDQAFGQ